MDAKNGIPAGEKSMIRSRRAMKNLGVVLVLLALILAAGLALSVAGPANADITEPGDGDTVSGIVQVSENSTHSSHRFQYRTAGAGSWTTFAGGFGSSSPKTAPWDTTCLLSGDYDIRSQYWSGGWNTIDTITVTVEGLTLAENPPLEATCGLDIVLVIDGSGSIDDTEYGQMQAAFVAFVDALLPATPTELALVEYAGTAVVRVGFTDNATTIKNGINGTRVQPSSQYTNWEQGLIYAYGLFPHRGNPDLIIFASDGNPNRKGDPPQAVSESEAVCAAVLEANDIKDDDIRIITIGVGDNLDTSNLIAISSADALYTGGFEDLAEILAGLACELCGGTITVHKVIDCDGDPNTTDDQITSGSEVAGWTFNSTVTGGSSDPTWDTTGTDGSVTFEISIDDTTATVSIVETLNPDYELVAATCTGAETNGTFDGDDSIDGIQIEYPNIVSCTFYNQPLYTLTVNADPTEGGTVSGSDTYDCGTLAPITASPNACYEFTGWTGEDITDTSAASTTVLMDDDKTVTANFEVIEYTLTVNASPAEGGTVTGNGTYDCGTLAPITASPNACYEFVNWSGTGINDTSAASTTVLMDGDKTVTANFEVIEYTLTVNADPAEGGTVSGGDSYECDSYAEISATANPCYEFVNWSGTGINDTSEASTTVLMDGDKTVTANFEKIEYSLTVNASPAESGTVTGNGTYDCGTYAAINATANPCYAFVNWSGATGITEPRSASTTVLMDDDKTVTANFTQDEYTLTINIVGNGAVAKDPDQPTYTCGTSVNLTATADPGWRFSGWSGDLSGTISPEIIVMNDDKTVTATFTRRGGGGGGGFAGPVCPEELTVDFLGEITEVPMTRSGVLCADCDAPSPDEMHLLEIEEGTTVLDNEGEVVKLIEITEVTAPSLPASTALVGNAYDFGGNLSIAFSQPVTLTLGYLVSDLDPDTLALSMRHYSSEVGLWEVIETESSQVAEIGSLTGMPEGFSVFAILADVPSFEVSNLSITPSEREIWDFPTFAVMTGEEAVIAVDVTNTANYEASYTVSLLVNGEIMDSQELTLAPGQTEQVTFTISGIEPGQYEIVVGGLSDEFTSSLWINWLLIGAILGALFLIVLLLVGWQYRNREKPA